MEITNDKLIAMIDDKGMTKEMFAKYFDHTLLNDNLKERCWEIENLCSEAGEPGQHVRAVCVYPKHIPYVYERIAGSDILPCTVIDFPEGDSTITAKVSEAVAAIGKGAKEFDYVINVDNVLKGNYELVKEELAACMMALMPDIKQYFDSIEDKEEFKIFNRYVGNLDLENLNNPPGLTAKFIIETGKLNDEQKENVCKCIKEVGLKLKVPYENLYVKTSTGKYKEEGIVKGATIEDIMLLKKHVHPYKVKAAGGINDIETALSMIYAGADRIGASKSYHIAKKFESFKNKIKKIKKKL